MKLVSIVAASLLALCAPFAAQQAKNTEPSTQETSLAAERRELAEIQLLVSAERKFTDAKELLGKLAESLSARTDAEAKSLLDQVKKLDRSVRRALGETVADENSILVNVTTREKGDTVDEAVLAALSRRDMKFIGELGSRAGPGLATAVREDPDALPGEFSDDALFLLLQLDPRRGDELLREMLEHDSFFWRKRVVRALSEASPWQGASLFSTDRPRRWLGAGIQQTLEKYVEDADVGREALRQLGLLSSAGADSAVLLAKIAEGMRSADSLQRRAVQDVLGFHRFEPMRPVLEAALEDEDPSVRLTAARILVNHPDSRALLAHATDAEPEVRKLVAKLLRDLGQSNWREEEPDALARLLAVEDDGIRGQA